MIHNILSLPHEVLHGIIIRVDPLDVASLCASCHVLNNYVKKNRFLFKELYLAHFVSDLTVNLNRSRRFR